MSLLLNGHAFLVFFVSDFEGIRQGDVVCLNCMRA